MAGSALCGFSWNGTWFINADNRHRAAKLSRNARHGSCYLFKYLLRSLGAVFGTALFGSILTNRLAHYMQSGFAELAKSNPDAIANFDQSKLEALTNNSALIKTLPTEVQNTVLQAFVNSFHVVFVSAAPVTAMGIFLALMLKEVRLRTNEDYKKAREEVSGEQLG